jgi:hypothetical protein
MSHTAPADDPDATRIGIAPARPADADADATMLAPGARTVS